MEPTDRPQPPDLPAFLLARVDEDEAHLRSHTGPRGFYPEDCQECGFCQEPGSPYSGARLYAECDAKRRIVEDYRTAHAEATRFGESFDLGWEYGTELALKFLALPYAGHEDYRAEWRP